MLSRPAAAVLVCALLLPCASLVSMPAEGWRAAVHLFSDGSSSAAVSFSAPGVNSSVSIRIPKAADLTKATVDISSSPYLQNYSITAGTRDDFSSCALSDLDINSTPGEVLLEKEYLLSDDFDGTTLDQRWSWLNPPSAYDVGITRAGYLHMVSNNMTNFNGSNDDGAFLHQNASGNFTLETKVNCTPERDWQKSGIMVRQDSDNWVALKYQNQTGKVVEWSVKSGGSMWNDVLTGGLSASTVYLRLVKDGSRWLSYYSTDGASWTLVWDTSGPGGTDVTLNDPLQAGLIIADGGSDTTWPADYDYFNFTRYVSDGTLVSTPLQTAGAVTLSRAFWHGPVEPSNTEAFFFMVRAGPTAQWQRLMNATTTPVSEPGDSVQYMFEMTSAGIRSGNLHDLTVNFSTMLYPEGLSLGLGGNAPFWNHAGALGTTEIIDFRAALADYIASAAPDADGNVTVYLDLACGSPGTPVLSNLTIEFNMGAPPAAPSLRTPGAGGFVTSLNPELTLNCTDPDNDTLFFRLEFSQDGFASNSTYDQKEKPLGWNRMSTGYAPGETATFTVPFTLVQGRTYSWRASAFDGSYRGPFSEGRDFTVDTTPPAGTVRAGDPFSGDPRNLSALLDFRDDESGIAGYEYMAGTGPGSYDVLPTTSASEKTITVGGLALRPGISYYITGRAQNRAGLWSDWVSSGSVQYWESGLEPLGIRISAPPAGTVHGIVTVSGESWLRDGWTKNDSVQFRIDDDAWRFIQPRGLNQTRTWSVDWDTRLVEDGPHRIQARLVDGLVNTTILAVDELTVEVVNGHAPPPLSAVFWPPSGTTVSVAENSRSDFWANASSQEAGITWFVDGELREGEIFSRFIFHANFTMAGPHNVTAIVSDGNRTLSRTWDVTVENMDRPPVAGVLTPLGGTTALTGEPILFNASASADPDPEDRLNYTWDMGDGTRLFGLEVLHEYSRAGNYTVTLTVSDGSLRDAVSINLKVSSPTRTIKAAGTGALPFAALGTAAFIAAAAGGAYTYLRRRRATRAGEAKKPPMALMYKLPAPSLVDEEDDEGRRPRVTSNEQWMRLESAAASRPGPAPVSPPEETSFDDIPEAEVIPAGRPPAGAGNILSDEEAIPEAEVEMVPDAPVHPARPPPDAPPSMARPRPPPQPPAPQPRKPADPVEELLALMETNR